MNGQSPAYYRARLDTFRHFIKEELPGHPVLDTGKKNSPLELLKQGFVHTSIKERFESRISSFKSLGIKVSDYRSYLLSYALLTPGLPYILKRWRGQNW